MSLGRLGNGTELVRRTPHMDWDISHEARLLEIQELGLVDTGIV